MRWMLLAVASFQTAMLFAEEPSRVGERVRVQVANVVEVPGLGRAGQLIGKVVAADDGTLTIRLSKGDWTVSVPRSAIARLDVSRGRRSHAALRGAGIGLAVGAAVGGGLGYSAGDDRCPAGNPNQGFFGWTGCLALFSAGDKAAMGAVGLGALGGLVGAAIGAEHAERWQRVVLTERKLAISMRPLGSRGAALTLRF